MKLKIKLLPAVMTVLSVLYLIYVLSSESTTLVADSVGGDPGGKVLPVIIALFLIAGFLAITIKERPSGEKTNRETVVLYITTLLIAILYVALTKTIGFVLLTVAVLYVLEYLYTTIGEKRNVPSAIIGGVGTVVLTAGMYTLMRLLTKTLSRAARKGALPSLFGNNTILAVLSLIFVLLTALILGLTVVKLLKKKHLERVGSAFLISYTAVLLLYVIFKQFFLVALAPGLLAF